MGSLVSVVYVSSTSCSFLQEGEHIISPYILPHTHTLLPLRSNTEQYWQLGSQPLSLRMWTRRGGGEETGRKRREWRRGRGRRVPAAALQCQVLWGARLLRRGEKETRGSKTEREGRFGWQPCSLSHQIRRSSEHEMSLCSKTSLLPPQTAAAGIQAHWFAARKAGGRQGRRGWGGGKGDYSAGVGGALKVKLTFISPNWLTHPTFWASTFFFPFPLHPSLPPPHTEKKQSSLHPFNLLACLKHNFWAGLKAPSPSLFKQTNKTTQKHKTTSHLITQICIV